VFLCVSRRVVCEIVEFSAQWVKSEAQLKLELELRQERGLFCLLSGKKLLSDRVLGG